MYYQYESNEMLKLYQKEEEMQNKKSDQEESKIMKSDQEDIYRILLRTGKFINVKDSIIIND